jgi:hypothetical protein
MVGNLVVKNIFNVKKESLEYRKIGSVLDVGVDVYHSSDRLKFCPYVYVLQILLIILYKDFRLVLVQVGANNLLLATSTLVRTP